MGARDDPLKRSPPLERRQGSRFKWDSDFFHEEHADYSILQFKSRPTLGEPHNSGMTSMQAAAVN
jgi:hypothetical protein